MLEPADAIAPTRTLSSPAPDRPKVLYLVHRFPYPPNKGDRIRTFHIARFLAARSYLYLACLADEPTPAEHRDHLRGLCRELADVSLGATKWLRAGASMLGGGTISEGAFYSPRLAAEIEKWAGGVRFDAVLASASSLAPYLDLPGLAGVPAVVDLIDVDSQKWLDYAAASRLPKRWVYQLEGARMRRLERRLMDRCRGVVLVSRAEADLLRSACGDGPIHAVPNGVDLDYFRPGPSDGPVQGCVFVGALDYRPNIDGAAWFCREVWPKIRARAPSETITLVGRRPAPEVAALGDLPGVEVVGQVPDVRPYLARAAVVVAPLRIARGVQNKVLEALAMAKAVVALPGPLVGIDIEPGRDALQARTPDEFAEMTLTLLGDVTLRKRLGESGRRYVLAHHCWETCLEPLARLLGIPMDRPV